MKDAYGSQRELPPFDTLVLALGYRRRTPCARSFRWRACPSPPSATARRVGKVLDAMHEAYTAAYNL